MARKQLSKTQGKGQQKENGLRLKCRACLGYIGNAEYRDADEVTVQCDHCGERSTLCEKCMPDFTVYPPNASIVWLCWACREERSGQ